MKIKIIIYKTNVWQIKISTGNKRNSAICCFFWVDILAPIVLSIQSSIFPFTLWVACKRGDNIFSLKVLFRFYLWSDKSINHWSFSPGQFWLFLGDNLGILGVAIPTYLNDGKLEKAALQVAEPSERSQFSLSRANRLKVLIVAWLPAKQSELNCFFKKGEKEKKAYNLGIELQTTKVQYI